MSVIAESSQKFPPEARWGLLTYCNALRFVLFRRTHCRAMDTGGRDVSDLLALTSTVLDRGVRIGVRTACVDPLHRGNG